MAKVGVLVEGRQAERHWEYGVNVFELYIHEILQDAGVPFQRFDKVKEAVTSSLDILIVGLEDDDDETTSYLWEFVGSGGTIISYGGLSKLLGKLNCTAGREIGPGYVELPDYINEGKIRFLNASPWTVPGASEHEFIDSAIGVLLKDEPEGQEIAPAFLRFKVGKGTVERWQVNIVKTIVGLQQGTAPVLKDGAPSSDGTGAIDEGILKTDDAFSLDWEYDRAVTETGQPYFHTPYADLWKDVLISHLVQTAAGKGLVLPFVDLWPDGVQSVAMISHDSDFNIDESAEVTLDLLKKLGIHTTWCMLEPGFSPHYYKRIQQEGHELAFHYNAVKKDQGFWDKDEFTRQFRWLQEATGIDTFTSNKNHFTRYEGWGELFDWCESVGIESEQSFGPSKRGNIGFIFGTCRPFFPIAWWNQSNRTYNVTEICFQTPDLDMGSWADSSILEPFLEQIRKVRGVAHIVFHQYHLYTKQTTVNAMIRFVETAKQYGFVFWTGKQVNDWVRARRSVQIIGLEETGTLKFAESPIPDGLVAWVPLGSESLQQDSETVTEQRYGLLCKKVLIHK